tara:strand:+ start:443 stop:856 length:414 start_codon:yes stop_codon:yes gene_type:complete
MELNSLRAYYDKFFAEKISVDVRRPNRCVKISQVEELLELSKEMLTSKEYRVFASSVANLKRQVYSEMEKKDLALLKSAKTQGTEGMFAKILRIENERPKEGELFFKSPISIMDLYDEHQTKIFKSWVYGSTYGSNR